MIIPELQPPGAGCALDALGAAALGLDPALACKARHLLERLERHHPASAAHSMRVARLAMAMRRIAPAWVGCGATALLGSLLHDVGKLYVPQGWLASDLPLSPDERQSIMAHAEAGASLLAALGFPDGVIEIAAHHHERWNGGGYPSGRPAGAFPRVVRAVAVADAFTAMTEPGRSYRTPLSPSAARQELEACQGTHFDPEAVAILVHALCEAEGQRVAMSRAPSQPPGPAKLARLFPALRRGAKARPLPEPAF